MHILGHGLYANDEVMQQYVNFITDQIPENCATQISASSGFPMKGYYVPVKMEIVNVGTRTLEARMTTLGHTKEMTIFLSREKSPSKLLWEIQNKIDLLANEIVIENGLDRDEIFNSHHPLRKLIIPRTESKDINLSE